MTSLLASSAADNDPWHYPRPELAGMFLKVFDIGLTSARGIFARRRMGKTEFLRKDLMPAAQSEGYLTAYVNLWDSRENPGMAIVMEIRRAMEPQGLSGRVMKALNTPVTKLKASGKAAGLGEGALEVELGPRGDAPAPDSVPLLLQETLRRLDKTGKKLLLILDEAQVLAAAEHANFTHSLRSGLDVRKPSIKVVFAGSSEATLRRMFAKSSEPFYNWAPLEPFDLLGQDFVEAMVRKVNEITKFPLHKADAMQAFNELNQTPEFFRTYLTTYLLNPKAGHPAALAATKTNIYNDKNFEATWSRLLPADQEVLRLMVDGVSDLHGGAARERLGLALGLGKPVTMNTPQQSLRRLQNASIVTRLDTGVYQFEDEAFAQFVKMQVLENPPLIEAATDERLLERARKASGVTSSAAKAPRSNRTRKI